jgi:hypothetical protein
MDEAFGDHGENEIALRARLGGEQGVEAEAADRGENGLDVAVRLGTLDAEGGGGGKKAFAGKGSADEIDQVRGKVGDIAEGFMLDLGAYAEGAPEQVRVIDLALVGASRCGHMNRACS